MTDKPGEAGGEYTLDEFEEYDLMGNNSDEESQDQHAEELKDISGIKSDCREGISTGIEEVIRRTKHRNHRS